MSSITIENLKDMRRLLERKIVVYQLYDYFINHFISEKLYDTSDNCAYFRKSSASPQSFFKFLGLVLNALKPTVINRKPEVDILFISRYRTKPGENKDYLFWSTINKVCRRYRTAIMCSEISKNKYNHEYVDNYSLVEFLTPIDIIRCIFNASKILFDYKLSRFQVCLPERNICDEILSSNNIIGWSLIDHAISNALDKLQPKVIIVNDDVFIKRKPSTFKQMKLIIVQSAVMLPNNEYWRSTLYSQFLQEDCRPDIFCASGVYFKEIKDEYDNLQKKTVIVGQPRFDELYSIFRNKMANLDNKSTDDAPVRILWTTQSHGIPYEENRRNITAIFDLLNNTNNIEVAIKLHPEEDQTAEMYSCLCEKFENVKIFDGNANLYDLLVDCDILLTKTSTTAIEAAVIGKDVIVMDFSKGELNPYVKTGIAAGVFSEGELTQAVDNLMHDSILKDRLKRARKNYLYQFIGDFDGFASDRIALLISSLID